MKNRAIRDLYGRWKFNADLMTCQECGYSVIASRMHETANHADGCKNSGDANPWLQLAAILQEIKDRTNDASRFESDGGIQDGSNRTTCGAIGQP